MLLETQSSFPFILKSNESEYSTIASFHTRLKRLKVLLHKQLLKKESAEPKFIISFLLFPFLFLILLKVIPAEMIVLGVRDNSFSLKMIETTNASNRMRGIRFKQINKTMHSLQNNNAATDQQLVDQIERKYFYIMST